MYRHAILRRPGASFPAGLSSRRGAPPDVGEALRQHEAYAAALRDAGLALTVLEADEAFPDGCFVEDTAVVTPFGAVITRPGAASRRGEVERLAAELGARMPLRRVEAPGTLEGGDVLRVGDHYFIGLSGRTNRAGAGQLRAFLGDWGFTASFVEAPGMLHLKTGAAWLGGRRLALAGGLAGHPAFGAYDRLVVPPGEAYAANCLLVNGRLLVARGYPRFRDAAAGAGLCVVELDMSAFRRMDGGLTCLSLLW